MFKTQDFKIKTKFIERNNGTVDGTWLCGIDIGYSSVKIFSPNNVAMFPSFAEKDRSRQIGTPGESFIKYKNLENGEEWIVGDVAQKNIRQSDTSYNDNALYGRERYDDPMFLVLIDTALGLSCKKNNLGDPSGKEIKIESGLPSAYLDSDKPLLSRALSGRHHFSLKIGAKKEEIFDITIKEENIDIMEQPMGTLMSIAINNDHRFTRDANNFFNKNVIIFDGGHGTLDTFVIKGNRVLDRQTFPEYAMKEVLNQTIAKIRKDLQIEVSPVAIQKALENGYVIRHDRFSSENVEFKDILEEENDKIFNDAIENIGRSYPLFEYDYFVITGGTGSAWSEKIKDKLKGVSGLTIINANQNDADLPFDFANVRGYYMFLYQNELTKQRLSNKKENK